MSLPTVSICIPTYNQAVYLIASVESALAQTYPFVEVWISDDCSTDDTERVARQLILEHPKLRYHRQDKNLGISANNNWLLAQPQTNFIVRLDSDDALQPDYVEALVQLMIKHPTAGYAHGAVQEIDEHSNPRRIRRLAGRREYQEPDDALHASVFGYRVAANICLFRAEALRELDYYRDEVVYVQDWDLSVRLADQGWGNVYCPKTLASYRLWEDSRKMRPRRRKIEIEGYIQVFDQVLTPAFARRSWSLMPIRRQRRKIALGQATVLDADHFSDQERNELWELLDELGASKALLIRRMLMNAGFGPAIRWSRQQQLVLKDTVKKMLTLMPSRRSTF